MNETSQASRPAGKLQSFRALRHPNYRWYWFSGLGMTGAQGIKQLALAWLVLDLTGSVGQLGFVVFMQGVPMTLMALFGGVLADRYDRRKLLIWNQAISMLNILLLAVLTITGAVALWHIYASSLILGVTTAFTMPARNAMIRSLVNDEDTLNAVALNTMQQQSSRILWPALAGIMIRFLGVGPTLLINVACFVFGIAGLLMIRGLPKDTAPRKRTSPITEIKDGVRYTWSNAIIGMVMTIAIAIGMFGLAFMSMGPGFARQVLGFGPAETGVFLMASGVGSVIGSVALLVIDIKNKTRAFVILSLCFALTLMALSANPWYYLSFVIMACFGITSATLSVIAQTVFQAHSSPRYLGRVVSLWSFAGGLASTTALPIGLLGEAFGLRWALGGTAAVLLLITLWVGVIRYPAKAIAAALHPQPNPTPVPHL